MARKTRDAAPSRRVFGLGIDEKIQWVVADVTSPVCAPDDAFEWGTLDIDVAGPSPKACDLEAEIRNHLRNLKEKRPALFHDIAGLGVSTIGVVNQHSKRLRSIARKPWVRDNDPHSAEPPFLVNFRTLFAGIFSDDVVSGLEAHNDATAKGLVEYHLSNYPDDSSTLYLMFGEGVNGGVISRSRPLPSLLHPEMGHITPRPHQFDQNFNDGSKSCPAHSVCFEGIASGARIRQSWGGANCSLDFNISDLRDDHPAWEIISHYVAQLCIIGTLILGPKRIVLGGSVITGREGDEESRQRNLRKLLPLIRRDFSHLNNNYLFYEEMRSPDFIQAARVVENASVIAALQVARLSAFAHDAKELLAQEARELIAPEIKEIPVGTYRVIDGGRHD